MTSTIDDFDENFDDIDPIGARRRSLASIPYCPCLIARFTGASTR
ncbi:MAG: hypothetical protein AAFR20_11410 [Pseudomonadota bacterium]